MISPKDYLASKKSEIIELESLLTSHIAIAPEGNGVGEEEKVNALQSWLTKKGFKNLERFEAPDNRVTSGKRPSLVATIPGKDDSKKVWVIAHTDVVPPGELKLWNTNPWEVVEKDGKLFGRGVEDDQQGLCSGVFAALYYLENNIQPEYTIKLLFAADEENGSEYGIIWLLHEKNLFSKEDLILIPDGGDSEGRTIEVAEKNILWLKIHVIGKQTHGSMPDSGNNACLAACDISLRLHNLEKVFNKKNPLFTPDYSTFQPTKREKNVDSINIIPGEDTLYFDCRILPEYSLSQVISKIEEIFSDIEKEYGVKIEYSCPQKSESPATPVTAPAAKKLASALKKVHGLDAEFVGIGGGTVAAELRREGLDAVVWSTLDNMCHQPNEYCLLGNLIKDAQTLIEFFS